MKTLPLDPVVALVGELKPAHVGGAQPPGLDLPAADFFDAIPWDGAVPDPDALDAETFLGLL